MNILLSENVYSSFAAMRIFLLSGILPFWTSLFIFKGLYQRDNFNYFCCGCVFVIASVETIARGIGSDNFIFMSHAIPLGTLMILLAIGPLNLLLSKSFTKKAIGLAAISLGLIHIAITQKRGSWLAVAIMATAWIFRQYRRTAYAMIVMLAVIALLIPLGWAKYKSLDKDVPSDSSLLHRLELYPFALHVFKQHPVWGIGLRSFTHDNYLDNYTQKNKELTKFPYDVAQLQTFDNMFLTAFVELGSLMTFTYLGLIFYVLIKFWHYTSPFAPNRQALFIRLLPLIGLAIQSLSYDSLIFPQINWLFHVQLGILAGYGKATDNL